MSLFRIVLFALIAFLLFRIIRTVMRLVGGRSRPDSQDMFQAAGPEKKKSPPFDHIQDADFEDLGPREGKEQKPSA